MQRALSSLGIRSGNSSKDLSAGNIRDFPADPAAYELLEDCGRGVSATVHRAICKTRDNDVVAVKRLNLETINCNLEEIIHEAQTMRAYNHPNVLPLYTSFVIGTQLYLITPYMSGGSILHIMKYGYPEGLEEAVIATIMREVLKGLEYVHKHGGIHRDVKAGNILVDRDGSVKIGDFGVAATIERGGSWGNDKVSRTTFVGTPCWMAPEVMEQTQGYDSSADIWSFGITLLELANGHAPFAKFPPMKVLLLTLQNPPPQLDNKSGKPHFSKQMRDVVALCLQKDPTKRPSATELLQHKFFKQGQDKDYLVRTLLKGLPALGERVQQIRVGKAATNAAENDRQLEKSQEEYVKGVSSWNFDLSALKAAAAAEPDDASGTSAPGYHPSMPTIEEAPEEVAGVSRSVTTDRGDSPPGVLPAGARLAPSASGAGSVSVSRGASTDAAAPATATAGGAAASSGGGSVTSAAPAQAASAASAAAAAALGVPVPHQPPLGPMAAVMPGQAPGPAAPPSTANGVGPPLAATIGRSHSAFAGTSGTTAAAAAAASGSSSAPASVVAGDDAGGGAGAGAGAAAAALPGGAQQPQPLAPFMSEPLPGGGGGGASAAGASGAGLSVVWSPPSASPAMSREGSSQGPLGALATPTPSLVQRKQSHGRFKVYEGDELPPPMSPPASREPSSMGPFSASRPSLGGAEDAQPAGPPAAAAATATTAAAAAAPPPPLPPSRLSDPGDAPAAASTAGAAGASAAGAPPALAPMLSGGGPSGALAASQPVTRSGSFVGQEAQEASLLAAAGAVVAAAAGAAAAGAPRPASAQASGGGGAAAAAGAGAAASAPAEGIAGEGGAAGEPKKRGRFKIIEEEAPSRGSVSKALSSADLRVRTDGGKGAAAGPAALAASGGLLPRLQELQEAATAQAAGLQRLIDSVARDLGAPSASGTPAAGDAPLGAVLRKVSSAAATTGGGAAGAPTAAPAAAAATATAPLPPLSRNSSGQGRGVGAPGGAEAAAGGRAAAAGAPLDRWEPAELAERLHERVMELERRNADLADENRHLSARNTELVQFIVANNLPEPLDSRPASRRTSQLAPGAAAAAAAASAAGAGAAGGGAGSAMVSPVLSPRSSVATPRPSHD